MNIKVHYGITLRYGMSGLFLLNVQHNEESDVYALRYTHANVYMGAQVFVCSGE